MSGILALLGSGEFTAKTKIIDKYILSKVKNPNIAILPTAAGLEHDSHKWIEMGVSHFKTLGAEAKGIPLISQENANDFKFVEKLSGFNYFYFSGGNPDYLLKVLKNSLSWKLIFEKYKNGATLVGSSAGAMVMGKKVWSKVYDFVEKNITFPWEDGLNLVDFGIIPHFDLVDKEFTKKQILEMNKNLPKKTKVVGIDENTGYIKNKEKWSTLGSGRVLTLN